MARRLILALAAIATLGAAGMTGSAAEAQERVLRFNGWLPPVHPINSMTMIPWAEEVAKATDGRVRIEFTPQSVVPPPRQFDAVAGGAVDIAMNVHGFTPGRFRVSRIASLPFLADNAEDLSVAFWRTHERFLADSGEYDGVHVLTVFTGAPGYLWSHSTPVRNMEDWNGIKVFCGVRNNCLLAEALGATPVQRPGPQVTEMIERRVVDAAFIDPASYKNFRLSRFIRYAMFAPRGFYAPTFYVIMNQETWNSLSEADRKAIGEISGEPMSRKAGADWDRDAAAALELMRKNDVEVINAEGDYYRALQDRLVSRFQQQYLKDAEAAGVDGEAALQFLREQIAAEAE